MCAGKDIGAFITKAINKRVRSREINCSPTITIVIRNKNIGICASVKVGTIDHKTGDRNVCQTGIDCDPVCTIVGRTKDATGCACEESRAADCK
jgi:hypothetical protein